MIWTLSCSHCYGASTYHARIHIAWYLDLSECVIPLPTLKPHPNLKSELSSHIASSITQPLMANYSISDDKPAFILDDQHAHISTLDAYGLERNRAAADNTLSLKKSGLLAVSLVLWPDRFTGPLEVGILA